MDGIASLSASYEFHPAYTLMVLLGLGLALAFPITRGIEKADRPHYYTIQAFTLAGALLGAKIAVVMGDAIWPIREFHDWAGLLFSGRSIIGALVFGFLFAEIAKPIMRYRLPPNDRFAIVLPFSIGLGRIGCHLVGCCRGLPHDGPLTVTYADGISRHPIALYEITFHLLAGLALLTLYRAGLLRYRLFALYLLAYGGFRFATEYLRVTEKAFVGFSAYQWFALTAVILGLATLVLRSSPSRVATHHPRVIT